MFGRVKLGLWAVVVGTAGGLVVVSLGRAEPYLAPSALPVGQTGGVVAGVLVVVIGVGASTGLETLAWRRAGTQVGLAPDGVVVGDVGAEIARQMAAEVLTASGGEPTSRLVDVERGARRRRPRGRSATPNIGPCGTPKNYNGVSRQSPPSPRL